MRIMRAPSPGAVPAAGPTGSAVFGVLGRGLAFIRFSHTLFALPFALGSMLAASRGRPGWRVAALIVLAMVCARTAAMVFNRLADWEIDQRNPRTAGRHRLLPKAAAQALLAVSAAAFLATAYFINALCFALAPLALLIVFFYSLTKRFTHYTQVFLGLALAVSPVGAWLAVTGRFAWAPLVLALAVLCWVAGFDLIYATMDYDFDREAGLRSLVVKLGIAGSHRLAQILHVAAFVGLAAFGACAGLGFVYMASLLLVLAAFVYEHRAVSGLSRLDAVAVNRAFFNANALVGAVFVLAVLIDELWR
jgi:4-hydroxybenzoate polyprenyltransferase